MKTKVKSHGDEIAGFCDKEIPKVSSNRTFLAVISLDSAMNKDGNCYPNVFLEEWKYIEKKFIRHIIESLSDDSDEE